MGSDNKDEVPSAQQIVDITVPPIPSSSQERFENTESNEFLAPEFAEYARETVGTLGAVGVAMDIVRAVSDDLDMLNQRGTRPGELEHHIDMINQLQQILAETVESEVETLDQPLFDEKVDKSLCEEDNEKEDSPSEKSYPDSAFKIAYIDRVSSSENIIAIPRDSPTKHFHVTNGCIGETCVVIDERKTFSTTTDISEKPVALPYSNISQSKLNIQRDSQYPLQEGELIQIPLSRFDEGEFSLPNREKSSIEIINEVDETLEFELVRVTEITEDMAFGKTVSKQDISSGERPDWITEAREKAKQKRSRSVNKSTDDPDNLNKLLKGKL